MTFNLTFICQPRFCILTVLTNTHVSSVEFLFHCRMMKKDGAAMEMVRRQGVIRRLLSVI